MDPRTIQGSVLIPILLMEVQVVMNLNLMTWSLKVSEFILFSLLTRV